MRPENLAQVAVAVLLWVPAALPQVVPQRTIASISVCQFGGQPRKIPGTSCPSGFLDTHQIVLGPDGKSINEYAPLGVEGLSDEHSSIFAPGMLQGNRDYLFFAAAESRSEPNTGLVVLSGGTGPNNGTWTLRSAEQDGYGSYKSGFGKIFVAPVGGNCPPIANGKPAQQDQTFDLSYAAPGSVVNDLTGGPGHLLMIYEGTNKCAGNSGGPGVRNNAYITTAIATSVDYGRTWPTYRGTSSFTFFRLPEENPYAGPDAPFGKLGDSVCEGNDCDPKPPPDYGRYPVLGPKTSIDTAIDSGNALGANMGDSEPAAFVDNVTFNFDPYVYVVHNYLPGNLDQPPLPHNRRTDLMIARALLSKGSDRLQFMKWNGSSFSEPGLGGKEKAIFPDGPYENCGDPSQVRQMGSISLVQSTGEYLLTFVCSSPTDPSTGFGMGDPEGAAWFYSISRSLTDPMLWSPPKQIVGSWSLFESGGCSYKGLYPSFMSLRNNPGNLDDHGYVFYLWGCATNNTPGGRKYSSRYFTITTRELPR